jgi:hypothetical protein
METISAPKAQDAVSANRFREAMVSIGGKWNNTHSYWMFSNGRIEEAMAIRLLFPDGDESEPINGIGLKFIKANP